ncbi:MAG TPA: TRAP transporter small permease [Deltaproteobacteria bacterium]|jgi:TRAP-type C4-dicarboxylate transport system permease small subunit|nr:TRAP transporter small permease [Deltaproteobacteria bacterium]
MSVRCKVCGLRLYDHLKTCPGCGTPYPPVHPITAVLWKIEEWLLVGFLGIMVSLVLIQIVLRNFFATGIMGGSEIVRHLVLWVAFLGAGVAAREGKHIRIDVAGRLLSPRFKCGTDVLTGIFSVVVCAILVYASLNFLLVDFESGMQIPFFNMPVWVLELIIPLGYLVITLRFALRTFRSLIWFIQGDRT